MRSSFFTSIRSLKVETNLSKIGRFGFCIHPLRSILNRKISTHKQFEPINIGWGREKAREFPGLLTELHLLNEGVT